MEHCNNSDISQHICKLIVIDKNFEAGLETACRNLCKDSLKIKFKNVSHQGNTDVQVAPGTGLGKAFEIIRNVFKKLKHALYQGEVYSKCEKGNFTFLSVCRNL